MSKRDFFVLFPIIVILIIISNLGASIPFLKNLSGFSLTDVVLILFAVFAFLRKPWGENLSVHFKEAYKTQLDTIEKFVEERNVLREECDTATFLWQTYDTPEGLAETMREQDGFPIVSKMGKELWEHSKESLLRGLKEIEDIRNPEDAAKILSNYSRMLHISEDLLKEVIKLRELKIRSKTGEISGSAMFNEEFAKDYPDYKGIRFDIPIRLKPADLRDGYVAQFWIPMNPFYPKDANTGQKAKKRDLSRGGDNWWLLSMSSPYWKYVEFVDVTSYMDQGHIQILSDGRQMRVPPKDYDLPDGSKLSDWRNRMFCPLHFERDGES